LQVWSLVALGAVATYVPRSQTVHGVHTGAFVIALKLPGAQAAQVTSFVEVEAVAT
jgi:hypothetical protein